MKILILGGAGYIGAALWPFLETAGHTVHSIDLEWFGTTHRAGNQRIDYRTLPPSLLAGHEVIVLLAGHSSVGMCRDNRAAAFTNNVANFVALLDKLHRGQRLIYASSASVYGHVGATEVDETFNKFLPGNYYDLTKWEIDLYAVQSGLDYYGLRFGTVCGFSDNLRTDLMLPKMVASALAQGKVVVSNPAAYRPLLGMSDLCRAVARICSSGVEAPGLYNLCSVNASIGEIALAAARVLGVPVEEAPSAPTYTMSMSTAKVRQVFRVEFTDTVESMTAELRRPSANRDGRLVPRPYPEAVLP